MSMSYLHDNLNSTIVTLHQDILGKGMHWTKTYPTVKMADFNIQPATKKKQNQTADYKARKSSWHWTDVLMWNRVSSKKDNCCEDRKPQRDKDREAGRGERERERKREGDGGERERRGGGKRQADKTESGL